jgi:hypothetical protein
MVKIGQFFQFLLVSDRASTRAIKRPNILVEGDQGQYAIWFG